MATARAKSRIEGLWHIVSMETWDEDYFNEEVQAFIEFEANGTGHFQFGYVSGYMDWRPATRDGQPAVEWSWEGGDGADGTPRTGRGWAMLEGGELNGMIEVGRRMDADFVAGALDASGMDFENSSSTLAEGCLGAQSEEQLAFPSEPPRPAHLDLALIGRLAKEKP